MSEGILLPPGVAAPMQQQRKADGNLVLLRAQIAGTVMAELMQVQYGRHLTALQNEAKTPKGRANGQQVQWKPIDVGLPAQIAVSAADAVLEAMGLIERAPRAEEPDAAQ